MTIKYKFLTATSEENNARLDRVLRKKFPYLTQGAIEKSLRAKLILVNQKKISSNYRLNLDDIIQISDSLIQEDYQKTKQKIRVSSAEIKLITDNIIYRDADLIVINKPAGLAVQGGSKIKISVDDLFPYVMENLGVWEEDLSHKLVHRLDKETSGILLIALNNQTAQELAYAFKNHLVEKKYLAVLSGHVSSNRGQISSIINKENKIIKSDNAITNYKVLAKKAKLSLVEYKPITGKTHQLRIHSLELKFPILGDEKYDPNYVQGTNLHLHAAEIKLPYKHSILKLKADLPIYFQKTIKDNFGNIKC